ncbi:MAG: S41 family peptidase, partial [Planctomycetales bacterium]|nr:S41 family peptidase [Planctomycetales bacterium]
PERKKPSMLSRSQPNGSEQMTFVSRVFLSCLILPCLVLPAFSQSNSAISAEGLDATSSLRAGMELEKTRSWSKAIQHYEEALRSSPEHAELRRRLLISRLHFDVVRRNSDSAIIEMIDHVSEANALELYSEVLARLETSYVEPVDMSELVRSGTAYLEVALTEPLFVGRYLRGQSSEAIEHFRTSIHKLTLARRIHNRSEARSIVSAAARAAEQHLSIDRTATVMQFVFGAVGLLDPYSSFLSSAELNEVESQIEGNFVGLGIALQPHEVPLRILSVIPGGPAIEAGLQAGDAILQIDSVSCEDVGAEHAADLLRGPERSSVHLKIRRLDGTVEDCVVARRRVEVPSVEDIEIIEPSAGIAYLRISSFQKTTANELDEALWSLHRQGMQSLIIDLRGNPGGWLDASVAVADRFLAEGGIVSTRGKNGIENQNYTASRNGTWQVPLTVLIDDQSASASEIFAGAIRDNERGILVGTTSYGKGSVQGLFHTRSLSSGIRLTVSKFYSPSGRAISEQGVQPNIAVNDDSYVVAKYSEDNSWQRKRDMNDRVLQMAIEQARGQRLTAQVPRTQVPTISRMAPRVAERDGAAN